MEFPARRVISRESAIVRELVHVIPSGGPDWKTLYFTNWELKGR
jgi:hypothetical protein